MKLTNINNFKKYFVILPLAAVAFGAFAETEEPAKSSNNGDTVFNFSAEVRKVVDKDLMTAVVYSRKTGTSLAELKETVSKNLNTVLSSVKRYSTIEVETTGIQNYANYDKDKVDGWVAQGDITLKSKDFVSMEKVLNALGDDIAINTIYFSVSPEKLALLEDEVTLEMIKKFQHKAEVIKKGLGAKNYTLSEVRLETPNNSHYRGRAVMMATAEAEPSMKSSNKIPLEAGKATIVTHAEGSVKFK